MSKVKYQLSLIDSSSKNKTNKVFQTIGSMTSIDHKRLLKFLRSPYFNQSKILVKLCEVLIICFSKEEEFIKEKIWGKIFQNKPFNDTNFRKACSDLLDLIEVFMASEIYFSDERRVSLDKFEFAIQHKVDPLFRKLINENESILNNKPYRTQMDYYYTYAYEKKFHELMNFDVQVNQKLNIEKISENLDVFYLTEKLKAICSSLAQKIISTFEYDLNDVESILTLCKKFDFDEHPELATVYYRYLTLADGDNLNHYFKLKKNLEKNARLIPQSEAIEIFEATLSYCGGRVNKGNKEFLSEYFDLFLKGIELGVFVVNGELASWRFNNIVVVGLRLGKFEWADEFVEKYKNLLGSEIQSNIVKFNSARIASYKKDYKKVLSLVKDIEYDDIIINLISKTMIVFSYYELDEYDTLESFIESFRTFINRKKDIQSHLKQGYLNLLGFVKRLMRVATGDTKAISKLHTDIAAAKATTVNQEWLLEKLEELRGNTSA